MIKVAVVFYGLCCAAPRAGGLDVVLVHGRAGCAEGHPHNPRLVLPTDWVDSTSGATADDVIALADGSTYYVWRLEGHEVTLSSEGTCAGDVSPIDTRLRGVDRPRNKQEETDIRWIPSIVELAGRGFDERNRQLTKDNETVVSSVVHLPGGGKLASVLPEPGSMLGGLVPWAFREKTAGNRVKDMHVVAERFIYQLDYELSDRCPRNKELSLTLEKKGTGRRVVRLKVPAGEGKDALTISVSNLPAQHSMDMTHFLNFYALLEPLNGDRCAGPYPEEATPGLRPAQCGGARVIQQQP